MVKDLMKKIEKMEEKINPHYDATLGDFETIRREAKNLYSFCDYLFKFGYMQGEKAAKAELKKAAVSNG